MLCLLRAFFLELHAKLSSPDKLVFLTVHPHGRCAQKMKIHFEKNQPIALTACVITNLGIIVCRICDFQIFVVFSQHIIILSSRRNNPIKKLNLSRCPIDKTIRILLIDVGWLSLISQITARETRCRRFIFFTLVPRLFLIILCSKFAFKLT